MRKCGVVVAICASTLAESSALAQQEVVASLEWTNGQSAGPRAQVRGEPNLVGDIWVIEDFTTTKPYLLTDFTTHGWVHPESLSSLVGDVFVVILDDLPPNGNRVLVSTPGAGTFTKGLLSTSLLKTTFDEQLLLPGDYKIMWAVELPTSSAQSIVWHQPGDHSVGGGEPDNGLRYFPATGVVEPVPLNLMGGGQTGVNFVLEGIEATCYADCDQSTGAGVLDVFDFLCFQNSFVKGAVYACDCDVSTGKGVCDVFDFLCFQDSFVAGCP